MNKKTVLWIALLFLLPTSIFFTMKVSRPQKIVEDQEPAPIPSPQAPIIEDTPKVDPLQVLLDQMTLEEKIGQMVILGFKDLKPGEEIKNLIQNQKIGGFILFKRNYGNLEAMVSLVNQLQQWNSGNPLPLFISIDEEGGTVSRLPEEGTKLPDARLLGMINDKSLTLRAGEVIGSELKALGVNLNYAPVLDIVPHQENKLLYKRAFGGDGQTVADHGLSFIQGLESQGVIAVPKHFPGHGDTVVDSHGKLPQIKVDRQTLLNRELVPFKAAIDDGISALMVGHLAFPLIDETGLPATKSKIMIQDILRKEMGYQGLVITDEIEMLGYMAKKIELSQAILQSIDAGVDVFIIGHTLDIQLEVLRIIKSAVQEGKITEERINESALRSIQVKSKLPPAKDVSFDVEFARRVLGSPEHQAVKQEILNRSKKR